MSKMRIETGSCAGGARLAVVLAVAMASTTALCGWAPAPIVFDTPSADENGIMVLGNGEVGATAWIGADGVLHTVLQNSDSWNEGGRHVKTGAVDYDTKSPVDAGTYRQELSMERGEFEASWKCGGRGVSVRYRVQHGTDTIAVCDVKGAPDAEAKVVNWRLYPGGSREFGVGEYELGNRFCEGIYKKNVENMKFTINADRLVPGGWCHVNRNETVAELMKVYDFYQATGDLGKPDLLSDRVFGGVTRKCCGGQGAGRPTDGDLNMVGRSPRDRRNPRILFLTAVTCLHPCKDEAEWLRRTNEMLDRDGWTIVGEAAKRAEHIAWWRAFWDRSHIAITPAGRAGCPQPAARPLYKFPTNKKLPLSFGVDSKGGNRFLGTFASAEVEFGGEVIYSGVPKAREVVGRSPRDRREGFRFACKFTTDRPERPQRLLDNMTPGGHDGFLVDVYQGRVRAIFGRVHVTNPVKVVAGRETSVEVLMSKYGDAEVVVDGVSEKKDMGRPAIPLADECRAVTTAYAAQRYLTACAGRGRLPIRFNGSLFTISYKGDPDYRRWGSGYWWQNTRLPYYPMFAAGDVEMTDSLFAMYFGKLDFLKKRTKKYFGHGGAFFPECMQPWGDHFMGTYGPECEWKLRKDKHQHHPCHKYAWVGQLELSLMAIMRWQYTRDDEWFKSNALPSIREFVRYFGEHFKLDEKGRYHLYPAQAVETWQLCTNPMTEVAGLTRVADLMLAMPDEVLSADDRAFFAQVRSRVPDLPTRSLAGGDVVFAPAEEFSQHRNVETPELYCVFPFRLSSFEKPNAEIGRRTYTDGRYHELYFGWAQDELNAAYLGLAEEARVHIAERAVTHVKAQYRWPSYWGPNYDWCPDQDEGGVFQNTIQSMLMQYEGDKIFLLPAWPREWNCTFKLHAPRNTVVEGRVENGKLKDLVVTPAARRKDVVVK